MEATVGSPQYRQRGVIVGVGVGLVATATVIATELAIVPFREVPAIGERLAFAARLAVFPTLMLALGVAAIGKARFGGEQMNPLEPVELSAGLRVHQRYLQNTLEQLVLHLLALFGLAADGTALGMRLLPALAACFVIGRALFWVGYLRDPLKRGPGFAMTFQPTLVTLAYLAVRALAQLVI